MKGYLFKIKWTPEQIALQLYHRNNPGVSILQLGLIYKPGVFWLT